MNCPHCGEPLGDKATFCPGCNKIAIPARTPAEPSPAQEKPPKKVAQRLYPPPQEIPQEPRPAPEAYEPVSQPDSAPVLLPPEPQESQKPQEPLSPVAFKAAPKPNRWKTATWILIPLAAIALLISIYVLSSTRGLRVELTKAQTERASAQASVESLGKQVAQLEDTLESTRQERDDLKNEAASLRSQVNAMESTVNQSTYDKDAVQRQLDEAIAEKDALAEQVTGLETELSQTQEKLTSTETERDDLKQENDTLRDTVKASESEINFYDSYVVFVMLSSNDKYYHKYDCQDFTQKNFLAYSTKLAESNGYSPCPKCCQ